MVNKAGKNTLLPLKVGLRADRFCVKAKINRRFDINRTNSRLKYAIFVQNFPSVMKKSHLIAIVVVAAAIGILISASKDVTTYATFAEASASSDRVKLVGQLVKDHPVEYDPEKDPNFLAFYLRDDKGEVRRVVLRAGKPQDFERSENIVLTGQMAGDTFEASDMLLKCPSKYEQQEIYVKSNS